jgi:hypothetical protein
MSMYLTSKITPIPRRQVGECGEADCQGKCKGCYGGCGIDPARQTIPAPGPGWTTIL